jgi:hypothetical protein
MTVPWRLWLIICGLASVGGASIGLQPGLGGLWWPIPALWLAAVWASFGLSVWASACLVLLGLLTDFITDAPIGAWPFALLCAYGVGLVAWDRQPPVPVVVAELIAVGGGVIAAGLALSAAGSIAGEIGFAREGMIYDGVLTLLLYPVVRFGLLPGDIREARR